MGITLDWLGCATFRLAIDGLHLLAEAPEYKEHIVNRGLRSLPVSFSTAS